jgi:hypothetical protein
VLLALVVVVVVAGVLSAGIWAFTSYADRDSWAGRGKPVAMPRVPPEVTQTEQPPNLLVQPAPVAEILYALKDRVLKSAGVLRPVGGSCDRPDVDQAGPATLRCTITYEGLDVDYVVTTRSDSKGHVQWEASADRTVVTSEGLLAQFWYRYGPLGATFTDLRCDGFPAVALVPVKAPLSQYCWAKPHRGKTVRVTFTPSDLGPAGLFTQIQGTV